MPTEPLVIGLTGNIATGKSTVGRMLQELGAERIDADRLAHEVMAPGTPAHGQIIDRFGPQLDDAGEIDRRCLGEIVFSDAAALADLEQIVHPAVIAESQRRVAESECSVCVVEAIKLIESGMTEMCDAVWVVTAPRAQQLERLTETRGLTPDEANLRIDAQPLQEAKALHADWLIDNSGSLDGLREQVVFGWERLMSRQTDELASGAKRSGGWLSRFQQAHPRLLNWLVLSIGMVALFLIMSVGKGLSVWHTIGLSVMCVLLAGVCTLIIGWE